ncbi:glutathione S-transferase N-terminal domain-containing protein [Pseudomonas sp. 102515]|uniref:glutathione S-transferase family protein n=1 Tax=Pseudomonas sp. 102515 TaxID=3071568 RepID=UPI002802D03F|nr:glutathione S-transferase N-terminal domain-containing protein [Pseudomonas sp. 102515]MDQ7911902.1 glutathione S-transferase N-terminal domain-containing protein [Pseudomonas sp. 102515]
MQLLLNQTSPYARTARVTALEAGFGERLTLVWSDPWKEDPALLAAHPGNKVPVLITDEGIALSETLLICIYLHQLGAGNPLAIERLQLAGLGQGLIDAAFGTVIARKHGGAAQDDSVLGARRLAALDRLLARLNETSTLDAEDVDFSHFLVAVGLDYLGFRLPEVDWSAHPRLVRFHRRLLARPSLAATSFQ